MNTGGSISSSRILVCKYCSKRHPGKCWKKSSACFRCGFVKQRVKDCSCHSLSQTKASTQKQNQRLVYAVRCRED